MALSPTLAMQEPSAFKRKNNGIKMQLSFREHRQSLVAALVQKYQAGS